MENEQAFRYTGFLMSYLTSKQIIEWADNKIIEGDMSEWLLNISLSNGNKNIILHELKTQILEEKLYATTDIYYFSLYRILLNNKVYDWKYISKEIYKLYLNNLISISDPEFFFSRLVDYIELIRDGFTGNMDMPNELIEFLSNYNEEITIFKELDFNVGGVKISEL